MKAKQHHVGGLNPLNRHKTLTDAVTVAKPGDTIVLHKNVTETVTINIPLSIQGNNHTLYVNQGKVGLTVDANVHVSDLTVICTPYTNGVIASGHLQLSNVTFQAQGPLLELYPTLIVKETGKLTAKDCQFQRIICQGSADLINCVNHSYYGDMQLTQSQTEVSLFNQLTARDCQLGHVSVEGLTSATNTAFGPYVTLNEADLHQCQIVRPESELPKYLKKEPSNGPLAQLSPNHYALRLVGPSTVHGLTTHSQPKDWVGLWVTDTTCHFEGVKILKGNCRNLAHNAGLVFQDSKDANRWQLEEGSTLSLVRSRVNANRQTQTALEELDQMIGLHSVKRQIKTLFNTIQMSRKSQNKSFDMSHHMIFAGDPGTGKTTVARLVTQALFEAGVIAQNKLVETSADKIVKGYVGQTGENAARIFDSALGGVLFIDEASGLIVQDGLNNFNKDVLTVLLRYLENHRDDLVVIAAGYPDDMQKFLASDPGLSRRFQWVNFDDYSPEEMAQIFEHIRQSYQDRYQSPDSAQKLVEQFRNLTDLYRTYPDANGRVTNGGNGGLVRNVYQRIIQYRNDRVAETSDKDLSLTPADIQHGFDAEAEKSKHILGGPYAQF